MIREGLEYLRECVMECREFDQRFTAHSSNRNGGRYRSLPRSDSRYPAFLQNLHFAAQRVVQPLNPALVLDLFYATMILTMIRRILFTSESSRLTLGLEVIEECAAMDVTSLFYQPMMRVLELSDNTFDEFCYDVYCKENPVIEERNKLGNWSGYSSVMAKTKRLVGVYYTLSEELKRFIDRVELKELYLESVLRPY